jgi:hypothetical protein
MLARKTRVSERFASSGVVCKSTFTCNEVMSDLTFHMINHSAPRNLIQHLPMFPIHHSFTCKQWFVDNLSSPLYCRQLE